MPTVKSIQPLGDRVAIRPDPAEGTPGDLIQLPEYLKTPPRRGTVVAVGPGRLIEAGPLAGQYDPPGVKPGDRVQFAHWGETVVEVAGEKLYMLRASDLFGILSEEPT